MKYLVTLLSIIYSINSFSQTPDPALFQTWYLYDHYSTDDNIHHPVSAIIPFVSPHVTFSQASNFDGIGACNSFSGTFTSPTNDLLLFDNFGATLVLCGASQHISLEGAFFSLFQSGGQYHISGQGDTRSLVISTPIFYTYVFGNSPLQSPGFDLKQAILYPNPADSKLFIDSQNNLIDKIEIFNSLGQTVKTINTGFDSINISDFDSGMYLIKIYSGGKTVTKKFIKI